MHRQPPSFAGAVFVCGRCFRARASFSFVGVVFVRGGVALVHGRSSSFVFMGLPLRSWAGIFVRGRSPSFMGVRVRWWATAFVRGRSCHLCVVSWWAFVFICRWSSLWAVVPLVGHSGGELVGRGSGELVGRGGGELVGGGGQPLVCGGGGSSWPFVVV